MAFVCLFAAAPAQAEDPDRGAKLFDLCARCHGDDGGGNRTYLAPAIAGMSEWYVKSTLDKFRGGLRGLHFDDISGMRMRPMSLYLRSEEDVAIIAKYVADLPPAKPKPELTGGDPERGKALYIPCVSCHGPKGEGMQPLNGPPLARSSDWYMFDQIKKFKAGIRGADPKDPIATLMRPMAMTLADDQQILDVMAYISTLAEE